MGSASASSSALTRLRRSSQAGATRCLVLLLNPLQCADCRAVQNASRL